VEEDIGGLHVLLHTDQTGCRNDRVT